MNFPKLPKPALPVPIRAAQGHLLKWRLLLADRSKSHLVGREGATNSVHVSTAITTLDFKTGQAATASGHWYQLHGSPSYDADAEIAWWAWAYTNGVSSSADDTQLIYSLMLSAGFDPSIKISDKDLSAPASCHVVY